MSKQIVTIVIRYPRVIVLRKGEIVDGFLIETPHINPSIITLEEKWKKKGYIVRNNLRYEGD